MMMVKKSSVVVLTFMLFVHIDCSATHMGNANAMYKLGQSEVIYVTSDPVNITCGQTYNSLSNITYNVVDNAKPWENRANVQQLRSGPLSLQHSSYVQCIIAHKYGTVVSNWKKVVRLDPSLFKTSAEYSVLPWQHINISCLASAKSIGGRISWWYSNDSRGERMVMEDDKSAIDENGQLYLLNNGGWKQNTPYFFKCKFSCAITEDFKHGQIANVTFDSISANESTRSMPIEVYRSPHTIEAMIGEPVYIRWMFLNNGTANLTWVRFKNSTQTPIKPVDGAVKYGGREFHIPSFQMMHAGTYGCKTANGTYANFTVITSSAPTFAKELMDQSARLNDSVSMSCTAHTHSEQPMTEWKMNNRMIVNSTDYIINSTNLFLKRFNENQIGVYQCIINNTFGIQVSNARLQLYVMPSARGTSKTGIIVGVVFSILFLAAAVAVAVFIIKQRSTATALHGNVKNDIAATESNQ